jgi:hypothetical protein
MFSLSDSTVGQQRLGIDNSGNNEFGPATPVSQLSVSGKTILVGGTFAQKLVPPNVVPRVQGSVAANAGTVTIATPAVAGFSATNGSNGSIYSFATDKTSFSLLIAATSATPVTYGVF